MKFAANLSFMFKEHPMCERYFAAKEAGFKAVECGFPQEDEITEAQLIAAKEKTNLQQVLINIYTGNVKKHHLGCAFIPGKEKIFAQCLDRTVKLAKLLRCNKIHLMAGVASADKHSVEVQNATYLHNLSYAASVLATENIIGLIEPINQESVPGYWLHDYDKAVDFIKELASPNIRLMMDIFHCQKIRGNVCRAIDEYFEYIGHVQIAQVPNRGEPGSHGELNYKYILKHLEQKGYDGWVGLEYNPVSSTLQGLQWLADFGYKLNSETEKEMVE